MRWEGVRVLIYRIYLSLLHLPFMLGGHKPIFFSSYSLLFCSLPPDESMFAPELRRESWKALLYLHPELHVYMSLATVPFNDGTVHRCWLEQNPTKTKENGCSKKSSRRRLRSSFAELGCRPSNAPKAKSVQAESGLPNP